MDDAEFEAFLIRNVNAVLARGALGATILGLLSGTLILVLIALKQGEGLALAAVAAYACGSLGAVLGYLARKELLRGWLLYAALLPFACAPTAVLLSAHFALPAGAASYITGPFTYLYFILIGITAFTFTRPLSWAAGVVSAIGYLAVYAVAREQLALLSHPDPILLQDLQQPYIFAFKALMMVFAGTIAGAVGSFSRKLVRRILDEERQRSMVSRLFGEYVSDEVREKLVREPGQVQGEKREIAVLFSDIRGFSTFSEQHPPEEIVARLNAYFDGMVDAVARSGGVVDKFIGDAVMATFGGFSDLSAPCDAALDAALAMRKALLALNATWAREAKAPFDNGVGIDFGAVVQGPLGSARRKDFTVVGDVVNTASRAEGLSKEHGYPIIVTDAVFDRLNERHRALCEPLGEVKVKGKSRPVRIYGVKDP